MAVTVSAKNYALINAMDDENDWNGMNPGDTTDFYKEGTECVGFELWGSGNSDTYYDHPTGSWDFSGTTHIRWWLMTTVLNELNTDANGGIQLMMSDGTNTGYWYVSGSTTYPGGWYNLVVDVSAGVDAGTKPTMSAVTRIGFRFNLTSSAKKVQSLWIDHIQVCDGLIAYGDDGGGYFDFDDILAADENTSNGWGVIRKLAGVFFLTGSIDFGDASGTNGCKFQAKSQKVIFEDRPVNANLYAFDVFDNGTGTTEFILGDKAGTAAIQGCLITVEDVSQTAKFDVDGKTDTDVDNFKLYGTVFYGADSTAFAADATDVEVIGCSFERCGQVDPQDCATRGCFFINTASASAALLWNESIDISDCGFFANTTGAGIEMPSAVGSPYAYDALKFSGNTYDVYNSSGSAISINKNNGSDPTTYEGSSVTFLGVSVDTVITCRDVKTFGLIENTRVLLEAADGTGDLYYNQAVTQITRSGSTATVNHSGHNLQTGDWVHVKGCNQLEYNIAAQITYVDSNNYSYTVSGTPDTPATGSPTVTGVVFNHLTSALGKVTDTRSWTKNQPLTGRARRSTSSPLYQNQPIVETVDKDNGLSVTVYLIPDE